MQRSTTAFKHLARAAGRFEVATLGPKTTEASTDAQNKEERPQLSTFYLHGRFAAKTRRLVTSETKKCQKIGYGRLKIHFVTEKFKKYFCPFFLPQNPATAARNWPNLPWLARATAPRTRPF